MEFISKKRMRNRKRKKHLKSKQRNLKKLEVRGIEYRTMIEKKDNNSCKTSSVPMTIMPAESFWANYKSAMDWQQKHNVAWWKSRCIALEEENKILRNKVRKQEVSKSFTVDKNQYHHENPTVCDDTLEFQVDNDLINFLEQSIRHKIELKKKRDSEFEEDRLSQNNEFQDSPRQQSDDTKDATLLYGSACDKITSMETALQAIVDNHKDYEKCCFWPNIPLKPSNC